ncbi:hypothetical protein OG455_05765 [Kitasatospora sp. NBC_01287]|uniref:hypothetical protein n=1 Tax=Kitasatospora sp. NBC_01287 TaxID=2903573 RepID=UPI00225643E6|nr:hypothetical protein [Kitasatospora sp. NBC_01287]MCX4745035.1 hypothetical protein [Kitasatospora sp. NBC_01287]
MTMPPDPTLRAPGVVLTPAAEARILDGLRIGLAAAFYGSEEHYLAPPVIARTVAERADYPTSFPQLLGTVYGAPEGGAAGPTDLVLSPAACHHVYPLLAGSVLGTERQLSVEAVCYRGEATAETGRLRAFRMYEVVRFGAPEAVMDWRDRVLESAVTWLGGLGLAVEVVAANDPFFGRPGRLMAAVQRTGELKWEIVTRLGHGQTQSVASANGHKDHFGAAFGLTLTDGSVAHSACLAFGLDRLVLALQHRHGRSAGDWPASVREALGL